MFNGNFAKLSWKHLCWCIFLIKLQAFLINFIDKDTPTQMFSYEIYSDHIFFGSPRGLWNVQITSIFMLTYLNTIVLQCVIRCMTKREAFKVGWKWLKWSPSHFKIFKIDFEQAIIPEGIKIKVIDSRSTYA